MIAFSEILYAKRRALSCLDVPYKFGGKWKMEDQPDPERPIDCSGLSRWVLAQCGVMIPDGSCYQQLVCVKRDGSPRPLDLGFADMDQDGKTDHVVIYIGEDLCVEARGKPHGKVITTPAAKWEMQKGFLGWYVAPGLR